MSSMTRSVSAREAVLRVPRVTRLTIGPAPPLRKPLAHQKSQMTSCNDFWWCPGRELNTRHRDFPSALRDKISPFFQYLVCSMLQKSGLIVASRLSTANNGELPGCKLRVIIFEAREQVPVHVKSHLDRAMPEQRLQPLWREALLDRP